MARTDASGREWVVRFSAVPLIVIGLTVLTAVVLGDWFVIAMWGPFIVLAVVVAWRPFCLRTSRDGVQIEYFQGLRWHRLQGSEIARVRYEHGLRDGRGRALIRVDTEDGRTVRIPGTAGIYWFRRAPAIPETAMQHKRLHLLSTVQMLSLVSQRLGMPVDTYDAISMNPRR